MRIHYLQHVPFEGPGTISAWAEARGHRLTATPLYAEASLPHLDAVDWLIVLGGPMSVYETGEHPWLAGETDFIREAIAAQKRVLGICLGAQLIAVALGARVHLGTCREVGWLPVTLSGVGLKLPVLTGLPEEILAFQWHSDTFEVPEGAVPAAGSRACSNQLFVYRQRVVAMQFHLETTRAAAERLIEHCGGRERESLQSILDDEQRFAHLQGPMWRLLDNLQGL